jgi:predicted TIM-barrel fold metal-dependent hydrolase
LPEIAHKTMFGSDWPGPGPREIKEALDAFRALPLPEESKRQILERTALVLWPLR